MFVNLGAVIIIGIGAVALLLVGQYLYKKYPKTSYVVWGLAVFLLGYAIYSFNTKNKRLGDMSKEEFVGVYKLDYAHSSFDSLDLLEYKDLLLTVKPDNTFELSRKVPFFDHTQGHWQHLDNGDMAWTEISIGDGGFQQAQVDVKKWIFTGDQLTANNSNNEIVFSR